MEQKFISDVQKAGWAIKSVHDDFVIAKCPAEGCEFSAKLNCASPVPGVDPTQRRNRIDRPVADFEDLRRVLRERREDLALTIREVEEIAGIAVDYLAKFEKDNPSKTPNASVVFEWVQSLGYEFVLRPADMPLIALRYIADTRPKRDSRRRRTRLENTRRLRR